MTLTIATMLSPTTTTNIITTIDHLQLVFTNLPVNYAHSHCNALFACLDAAGYGDYDKDGGDDEGNPVER